MTDMTSPGSPSVLLVAVDASPQAPHVLAYAAAMARGRSGAVLHVVHVVAASKEVTTTPLVSAYAGTLAGQREFLDGCAMAAREASGVTVVGHLREGDVARAIVQTAASIDADLVILGTHDRAGVARLVAGSVAVDVMRRAECPVVVVRKKAHHATQGPSIEPPCPDCLAVQAATAGKTMWCARHAQHHPHAHLHYAGADAFATPSSLVRG